jgi:hypothetical protein
MVVNRWPPEPGRIGESSLAGVAGNDALEPAGDGR